MYAILLLGLVLSARVVYLNRWIDHFALVGAQSQGLCLAELRRKAALLHPPGAAFDYPRPHETRLRVIRVAGLPVWRDVSIVGLPLSTDTRIDTVSPAEFDDQFSAHFRLSTYP